MTTSVVLLVGALGAAGSANAEVGGWYATAFAGQSKVREIHKSEFDGPIIAAFDAAGFDVVSSSLDKTDIGLGVGIGYIVNPHFGAELSYVDLGALDYSASAIFDDGVSTFDATADAKISAHGPVLSLIGRLPIGERFAVYGRAGIALMDVKFRLSLASAGSSDSVSDSTTRSNAMFGLGGEFDVSERFAIVIEWDRYADVGSKELSDDSDVDLFNAGIRFHFR